MTVEAALYNHLRDRVPELQGRIYPLSLPQTSALAHESLILPAVVYAKVSGQFLETLDGGVGIVRRLFQITVWDKTLVQSVEVMDKVRVVMQAFRGVMGGMTGVEVRSIVLSGERHAFDPQTRLCGDQLDVIITHKIGYAVDPGVAGQD